MAEPEDFKKTDIPLAQSAVSEQHPHLHDQFFSDPVRRFINPPAYEGLKLEQSPSAVDALTQPGVISALRDILDDLSAPPATPDNGRADD